jgi:hypothetical protein
MLFRNMAIHIGNIYLLERVLKSKVTYCDVHAVGNMAFVYDSCYGKQSTVETLVYSRC